MPKMSNFTTFDKCVLWNCRYATGCTNLATKPNHVELNITKQNICKKIISMLEYVSCNDSLLKSTNFLQFFQKIVNSGLRDVKMGYLSPNYIIFIT